jgi:glucan phosphoethanolaminetransferase (alkaline phosphatase superfamily)
MMRRVQLPATETTRLVRRLATEVAVWYCVPALFMFAYIQAYSASRAAVAPHFAVITVPLAGLILMRLTLARCIANRWLSRIAAALLCASAMALLLLYYGLVVVGLHSWGGVVAWNVIPTFFAEAPELLDALGVSRVFAAGVLGLVVAGLLATAWSYFKRGDWAEVPGAWLSGPTFAAVVVGGWAILALEVYKFSESPWTQESEPVSLTFFPLENSADLEGHAVNRLAAANLDKLEDEARAAYIPATSVSKRNLILIVVDAMRPDHMGIYGYGRDTTPDLSLLAKRGVSRVISGVHSSCGDTICGLLSLVSSKFPRKFSLHPFTLHEALRRNGYRVHLLLSGDHTYFYSLKGFYGAVDTFYDGTQARGYFMNDDQLTVDRLAAIPDWDGTPAMFQFHLMSAHILRKSDAGAGRFQPAKRYLFHNSRDLGAEGVVDESATNFYDNGVIEADRIMSSLLQTLQRKGYLGNALVVITADHGESLGEHGLFQHANSVREELLRIPLVLISYGYQPERAIETHSFASQVDISPTLLVELGVPRPLSWTGRALQEVHGPEITYFEEHGYFGLFDRSDPQNTWKYWTDSNTGVERAYDLSADPAENHDALLNIPADVRRHWHVRALSGTSLGSTNP